MRYWLAKRAWGAGYRLGQIGNWLSPSKDQPERGRADWSINGNFSATDREAEAVMEKVTDYLTGYDWRPRGSISPIPAIVSLHRLADPETCPHPRTLTICRECEDPIATTEDPMEVDGGG